MLRRLPFMNLKRESRNWILSKGAILIALSAFILLHKPAGASETYGLSMTGAPKYGADSTHLDYANPDAPEGGTLRQAAIGTFDSLNPYALKGKAALGLDLVYDRLAARVWDEPFTLSPLIAESLETPEDRSSLTVRLDPAARFHDGTPITPEDVIFTFDTLKTEGRPNMRRVYQLVERIERHDARSLRFVFGPGHDRETAMILAMMPVFSKADWAGKTFDSATLAPPLGSGPYKIANAEAGRRIVYERVPDYWAKDKLTAAGHFNFDRIVYDYYRDDTIALQAFKAGELNFRREDDVASWLTAYDVPAVKAQRIAMESLRHGRPDKVRAFIFNTRRPPFDDIRVRRALNLAFDFDWANDTLYHGAYERISSFYPNTGLAANGRPSDAELAFLTPLKDRLDPAVFGPAYAPPENEDRTALRDHLKEAAALLGEAGWVIRDGRRVNEKTGEPLTFEILLDSPGQEKLALALTRNLKRLGIAPRIRLLDSAAFTGRLTAYDFDMLLYYWLSTLSPGTEQYLYWSCESARQEGRWNYAGICDPAVDALARSIPEAESRSELEANVRALDRVLTHGHYMIPLYYKPVDYVAYWANQVARPAETPLYGPVLETWWAPQGGTTGE